VFYALLGLEHADKSVGFNLSPNGIITGLSGGVVRSLSAQDTRAIEPLRPVANMDLDTGKIHHYWSKFSEGGHRHQLVLLSRGMAE
jgi:hypothetical protein